MAYTNPILGAIQNRQAAQMQNKQFEAGLAQQLAVFKKNILDTQSDQKYRTGQSKIQVDQFKVDDDYRKAQAETQKNQFTATLGQQKAILAQGAKQWDDLGDQRIATLAGTKATTANTTATAANTGQKTIDLKMEQQNKQLLKLVPSYMESFTTNGDPMSAELLQSDPQKMASFVSMLNADGVRENLFTGSNGEDYFVRGIVDVGDGRQVVELYDPKNPKKQMYLSKYRTAEEGDPISAGNAAGFGILKNQIDAAFFTAGDMPLPKTASEMAQTIAEITGTPVGGLDNNTVNAAFEVGSQLESQTQPDVSPATNANTNNDNTVPPKPTTQQFVLEAVNPGVKSGANIKAKAKNRKTIAAALETVNTVDNLNDLDPEFLSQIPRQQINTEINTRKAALKQLNTPTYSGRLNMTKNKLTPDQEAEKLRLEGSIEVLTQFRDSGADVKSDDNPYNWTKGQIKAIKNVTATESMPESFLGTDKEKAVDEQILADAPPTPLGKEQVAKQIGKSLTPSRGKISGKNLFNMKRLMNYGFLDADSAQRVFDLGVFSSASVEIIKENISQNGQTSRARNKISTLNGVTTFYNADGIYAQVNTDLTNNQGLSITEINKIVDDYQSGVEDDGVEGTFKNLYTKYQLGQTGYGSQPTVIKGLLNNAANQLIHDKADITFMSDPYDWSVGGGSAPSQGATSLNRIVKTESGEVFTVDRYGRRTNDRDMRLSDFSPELQTMIETTPHNTLAQARNTIQLERLTALKQIIANAGNDTKVKAYVTAELDRMEQDEIAKGQ